MVFIFFSVKYQETLAPPCTFGAQMLCIQVVQENKTQFRSPTQNFGQHVRVLKQLRNGWVLVQGNSKCGQKTIVSLYIHFPNLWQNTVTGPTTPIRIRIPNISEKCLVSVIRNQSFTEIVMTSYVSIRVSISQRAITLSCCVTNQSVTRFRNSHYRLLATHTHTRILCLSQCTYSCQLYQHASKYIESCIPN